MGHVLDQRFNVIEPLRIERQQRVQTPGEQRPEGQADEREEPDGDVHGPAIVLPSWAWRA
jgi:hypothetical protein